MFAFMFCYLSFFDFVVLKTYMSKIRVIPFAFCLVFVLNIRIAKNVTYAFLNPETGLASFIELNLVS